MFENILNTMKKIESLSGLKGKAASDITNEELSALNSELAANGFNGIEVSLAGFSAKLSEDLATKVNELETANNSFATANAEIVTLKDKLAKLPGAEVKELAPKEDKIKDEESVEFNFDESPSAKAMKKIFG